MCPCHGTGPLYSGHTLDCWDLYLWADEYENARSQIRLEER